MNKTTPRSRLLPPSKLYSLRTGLLTLVLLGIFIAAAVFVTVLFGCNFFINRYYVSEKNKTERQIAFCADLQAFVAENRLSSEDMSRVNEWLKRNRYVYLLLYQDDELIFSSGTENDDSLHVPGAPGGGITVDYPTEEELRRYAENGAPYPLVFSDQTVICSVTEFTEYIYYDAANIISLVAAIISFALIILVYFGRITKRISRLADDVAVVAEGDMGHTIFTDDAGDEISTLTRQIEDMRSSIVSTLENEREAVNANTELITAMSHDIRTPLTVLLGYLDVMKLHTDSEACAAFLKKAEATAIRLKELSDDMFRYFVVFGNRMDVNLQPYDAAMLLEQLLAEHVLLLTEGGYCMQLDPTPSLPLGAQIISDAPQLMRIIDNIFSNITKYADQNLPIFVHISAENDYICLHFRNSIRTNLVPVESTGIGLKTCSRIAEALHATFTVRKDDGVFSVTLGLPLATESNGETEVRT